MRRAALSLAVLLVAASALAQPLKGPPRRPAPGLKVPALKPPVPVVVSDPLEEALPRLGLVYFEDAETGEICVFDSSGPEAREYQRLVRRGRDEREALFRKLKIDFINARTDQPYLGALISFFQARWRRLRH